MFHEQMDPEAECDGKLNWDTSSGSRSCAKCGKRYSVQVINKVKEQMRLASLEKTEGEDDGDESTG